MAKLFVHECDKCGNREEKKISTLPSGWATAIIKKDDLSGGEQSPKDYLWCSSCYYLIIQPVKTRTV